MTKKNKTKAEIKNELDESQARIAELEAQIKTNAEMPMATAAAKPIVEPELENMANRVAFEKWFSDGGCDNLNVSFSEGHKHLLDISFNSDDYRFVKEAWDVALKIRIPFVKWYSDDEQTEVRNLISFNSDHYKLAKKVWEIALEIGK